MLGNPQSDRRSGTVLETGGAEDGPTEFNRLKTTRAEPFVALLTTNNLFSNYAKITNHRRDE